MAQMQVHKEPSELSFKNNTCLPKTSGTTDTNCTDYAPGKCEKTLQGIFARYTSPDVPDTQTTAVQITTMALPSG